MTDAIDTAAKFADFMEIAAFAGPVRGRDIAARRVQWFLTNTEYWGGPPPTLEEAQKAARHAWGDSIPPEIVTALGMACP
jgi:hypothetical protein